MGCKGIGLEGIDIRGEGGLIICPGAIGDNGEYKPDPIFPLIDDVLGLSPWPKALLPKMRKRSKPAEKTGTNLEVLRSALMAIPNDNDDRDWWFSFGAALHYETNGSNEGLEVWHEWSALYSGYDEEKTEDLWCSLRLDNNDPITGHKILNEASAHGWYDPNVIEIFDDLGNIEGVFTLDEDGVIRAFTAKHKNDLRFDHDRKRWFKFDGNIWRQDNTKLALSYARALATKMAKTNPKAKPLRKVNSWEAIERGARTERIFATESDNWNRDHYLLGTPQGTVHLRTGELLPSNPSDLISRSTSVTPIPLDEFDLPRDCPHWHRFLNEALNNDAEAIRFFQMWCGYSLTGDTKEQALVFIYGIGGGGKSTAINTAADILGDYAINVQSSTLSAKKHEAHLEELARLNGSRMAWASETEKGRAWAENRIKSLTGGDTITARFMRQDSFEFTPQMKLVIVGNNQPALTTVDEAIKRRFIILPFDHPPKVKDMELPDKLKVEGAGILSWMIQGCLDWQANGLIRPKVALLATASYFDNQDLFKQWLDACCVTGKRELDTTANLWESWNAFCYRQGEDSGSKLRTFPETLTHRGFTVFKTAPGIRQSGYRGLSVIEEDVSDVFSDLD